MQKNDIFVQILCSLEKYLLLLKLRIQRKKVEDIMKSFKIMTALLSIAIILQFDI